jgi:hypothetical protein
MERPFTIPLPCPPIRPIRPFFARSASGSSSSVEKRCQSESRESSIGIHAGTIHERGFG